MSTTGIIIGAVIGVIACAGFVAYWFRGWMS